MYGFLYKLGAWLLQKLAVAALIVIAGLAGYGLWIFLRENVEFDRERIDLVRQLNEEIALIQAHQERLTATMTSWQKDLEMEKSRVEQAGRVLATLQELEDWWERWFGDPEQRAMNQARAVRMRELQETAARRAAALERGLGEIRVKLGLLDADLESKEARIAVAKADESKFNHYLHTAWDRCKWYVVIALAGYFFGPSLVKLIAYYGLAPLLSRGRPIRFADAAQVPPSVSGSRVSIDVALWPGEVLRLKEKFLQASDENLSRKTRFVLDWRIPFTSVACGLIELVELRQAHAAGEARVTFSTSDDPHTELAEVTIPPDSSLILRPSFLAGVITPPGEDLKIRRRWAIWRWQSWVTLQFRFFEFVGPCRLVVAGSRGVRAEVLRETEGARRPARRTNQVATIGFTPDLDYLPVRAETFWGYYRNMNPLFDDLFSGPGLFLLQETSRVGEEGKTGNFWATVWNGVLKVFGM